MLQLVPPRRLFGTDGIRGLANRPPMDAMTALRLGLAAGQHFNRGAHRHRVVVGKDTRLSGYLLEPALTAGFVSAGMEVVLVGPLPTPAVAMLTHSLRCDLGVMLSASHNPYQDNGIKLFGPDGLKLSDAEEADIEALMAGDLSDGLAEAAALGRVTRLDDAAGRYIEAAKAAFPSGLRLGGLRVVIDCANGAAYRVAPTVLWELGAEVVPVGTTPNGRNINLECGSTSPGRAIEMVLERRADIGIALDGDADRLILIDERGQVIDGDQILALVAAAWAGQGRLRGGGVVATVMSNLGLERYLESLGLRLFRTQVGDRYVAEKMRETGCNLGGEQSGHLILSDYGATGDGLVAALQVLAVLVQQGRKASEVCAHFTALPQTLVNIPFAAGQAPLADPAVIEAVAAAEARLGDQGRLLIRLSGTEPLIRVMVEARTRSLMSETAADLADIIRARVAVLAAGAAPILGRESG